MPIYSISFSVPYKSQLFVNTRSINDKISNNNNANQSIKLLSSKVSKSIFKNILKIYLKVELNYDLTGENLKFIICSILPELESITKEFNYCVDNIFLSKNRKLIFTNFPKKIIVVSYN